MTEALSDLQLAFFMTKGVSLAQWDRSGQLDREVDYLNRLAQHFHQVLIFSYGRDAQYQQRFKSNVTIISKTSAGSSFLYQFALPFIHRRRLRQCRILKTNQLYAAVPALIAKMLHRKSALVIRCGYIASLNAVLYRYSLVQRWYTNWIEWLALRMATIVLIPTKENAEYLKRKYAFAAPKIVTLNNAVNLDIFRPLDRPKRYDIGYVGRLDKDKNLASLLQAATGQNLTICFIGQGPERERLTEYARENNIPLTIIDRVSNFELPEYYNSFAVFVFPSRHEGNPKTLLEAMACSRPVIAYPVIGVKNIITTAKNGLLVEDVEQLRTTIQRLFKDEKSGRSLGQAAREYILKNFDIAVILSQELRYYQTLINLPLI